MGFVRRQIENSPPGKIIRKTSRAATGGAILFVAFMALMVFRHGLGGGTGNGIGAGSGNGVSVSGASDSSGRAVPKEQPKSGVSALDDSAAINTEFTETEFTEEEKNAVGSGLLTVLIDEHDYLIQTAASKTPLFRKQTLPDIIRLAKSCSGDANGIRVRILRRENARASAEEKLKLELVHAGITEDSLHMTEQFVP
ncbi:MAG: hypothetical protein ACK526_11575 [Planctomyces sp.]|jgi:hypothetical protein